ncbi:TspO/MBR family protein [Limnohabitans sp. 63ED37-2]|uniref:TspO/MBR family protein n=1 Tax=Limnohabitans sp. 63ED37-2 TaxID=1678128 RepID=UPI0007063C5B|nr:TspO/MBR family protein [Limnohabitans sp. 63ED37-2]ALK87892.1 TspO/MBR family protein [Limnohabitans sp. 63ED37-2]
MSQHPEHGLLRSTLGRRHKASVRTLLLAFVLSYATAGIGAALTELGPWYFALKHPPWKPPDAAFGVIWSTIFTLCAISAWLAWQAADTAALRRRVAVLFGVNAVLNILWSWLYFKLQRPDWALFEVVFLWMSILALIMGLWRLSRWASLLLITYWVWVSIAAVLNLQTVMLNGPFGAQP